MRKLLALIFSGPLLTISIVTLSLITSTLAFTPANAAPNSIEIISISEVSSTSVEILFKSSVPKNSIANYVITAAVDPSVGQAKNIKKIIKTKATGLITAEIKNLNPKVAYKFSVQAKTNKAKMISSEVVEYYSLSNLMDVLSNLPANWGNPKPIPTPTPTPTPTATVYTVGQTGPGGGKVFYVATTPFSCGPTLAATCTYLEAAPTSGTSAWTDVQRTWSTGANQSASVTTANGTTIGTGYKNSLAIVAQTGNVEASSAAVAARGYGGPNSLSDWYLPSQVELNQMCKWQRGITGADLTTLATVCTGGTLNSGSGAAGFVANYYWSSSENGASTAGPQDFSDGRQYNDNKSSTLYVRPVRAF